MKRFFVGLLIAALLLAVTATAFAAGTPKFFVEAPTSAKVGDTITVSVKLTGEYTAHLITLHFSYDPNSFEYVSHTRGEVLTAASEYGMALCEKAVDKPTISVGVLYAGDEGLSIEGTILEAKFKVLSTAASNARFNLEVAEFGFMPLTSTSSTPIQHTTEGASVAISGSGGGTSPTNAPITTPAPINTTAPGTTTAPGATTAPGSTDAPAGTEGSEPGVTENAQPGTTDDQSGDTDATGEPVPDDKVPEDGKAAQTENANEGDGNKSGESGSGALKAVLIALGCLLAAGLGWLGVHFLKKAREAGNNK